MTRNMKLVQAAASFALTGTGGSCSAVVDLVSVLKGLSNVALSSVSRLVIVHHLLCWAIPSGSLLVVRLYPSIGGRYMGNKYHVLHRPLSRLSRSDNLGLGVAVPSIHSISEKTSSRQLVNRGSPPLPQGASPFESALRFRGWHH